MKPINLNPAFLKINQSKAAVVDKANKRKYDK